jgi:hypothetical protein
MNFIEAWKKANGKTIVTRNECGNIENTVGTSGNIAGTIQHIGEKLILSEKWEVAKETKVVWTVTYISDEGFYFASTFSNRTNMETWKENNKSRTRIIGIEKYIDEY